MNSNKFRPRPALEVDRMMMKLVCCFVVLFISYFLIILMVVQYKLDSTALNNLGRI